MKFWIVWSPQGKNPPVVKFPDPEVARKAAEGLARRLPGQEFHVLGLEGTARMVDVAWEVPLEPLPF